MPPTIDKKKCDNCGTCVDICPVQVFEKVKDEVKVKNPKECLECGACEVNCTKKAIKLK